MKLSVNRNTVWCDIFASKLYEYGIKHVCISPGSRSTPLTLAFTSNNKFKSYPIVDERSSAFFALGIAKKTGLPVVVITTSGTAVAELYPAIIEAYYQRLPLIICTADRPKYLRESGANQTINQKNIFSNHIRFFNDVGLPQLKIGAIKNFITTTVNAISIASILNRGPVHLNFPFEKPFEPDTYTDKINHYLLTKFFDLDSKAIATKPVTNKKTINWLSKKINSTQKGLIFCGYNNYDDKFHIALKKLSKKIGYPIWSDGSSGLRFSEYLSSHSNYNALIRSKLFLKKYNPDLILHFGGAPISIALLDFFKNCNAEKIIINNYGDKNAPSRTAKTIIKTEPTAFCNKLFYKVKRRESNKNEWLLHLSNLEFITDIHKKDFLLKSNFSFEGKVITEIINMLPSKSNLMVSNSLPIRDTDFFVSSTRKKIKLFTNRGASGIDGINSTALGIASVSKTNTYLITGDLAFFHDLTGLHNSIKFNVPLTIILINNRGGGIFESLPISRFGKIFQHNFITDLKLDNKMLVKAIGGYYYMATNSRSLKEALMKSTKSKSLSVIEIFTNAKESKKLREKFWHLATKSIDDYIDALKN